MPKYMLSEATLVTAKERLREEAHRQHRLGGAALPADEARQQQPRRAIIEPSTVALVQPSDCARTSAEHDAERAARAERQAGQVERRRTARGSRAASAARAAA